MGIFRRFRNIMSANVNAALDDMENPSAMLDQYIRNMQNDLSGVKADTANVMAIEKGIERKIALVSKDIIALQNFANKAITSGNEDDAKAFLTEKIHKEAELEELKASYEIARANSVKMLAMHDALAADIQAASDKRAILKSKIKVAKTQGVINRTASNCKRTSKNLAEFERLEDKINTSLDTAYAMECIDVTSPVGSIENLKGKYAAIELTDKVETQLLELKEAN